MIIIKRKKELFLKLGKTEIRTGLSCKCRLANGSRGRKQGGIYDKKRKKSLKTGGKQEFGKYTREEV